MDKISTPGGMRFSGSPLAHLLATFVALGAFALPATAAVYKWVDPQGNVHYSDLPPPPEGKLVSIDPNAHTSGKMAEPAARAAVRQPSPAPAAAPPVSGPAAQTPEANARMKQEVENDVTTAQADQCKQAQDRYQNYVRSRRLYKEGPNKERIYLTDQELETERLNA